MFDEVGDAGYWQRGLRGPDTTDNKMRFRFVASAAATNIGDAAFEVMTGVLTAWVYPPDADRSVSEYMGPVTEQGIDIALAPGQSSTITPVYFGTASPDPAVGYYLPPGPYEVFTAFTYRPTPGRRHEPGKRSTICRPPAAWDHLEVSSARSMGPPVRQ